MQTGLFRGKDRRVLSVVRRVLTIAAALLLVGLGQGLLLVGLLVLRRDLRTPSTLCLAGVIAAVVLSGFEDAALHFGWLDGLPGLAGLTLPLLPMIGPCLKGHVEAVLAEGGRPQRLGSLWLAVLALAELAAFTFLFMPGPLRLAVMADRVEGSAASAVLAVLVFLAVHVLSAGLLGAALFAGLRNVRSQARTLQPGDPLASRLVWLRGVLGLVGLSWLAYGASLIAGMVVDFPADRVQAAASILQVISLYALGLLGLVRPDRMLPPPRMMLTAVMAPATGKYGRSALSEAMRTRIVTELQRRMAVDHLYRDPLLTLPRLASVIGVSANDLSQAINTALGLSYSDYMARLRIAAAKEILGNPNRSETVTEILLEVGFNSKSVFNAAFKRETGLTPSDYRRQITMVKGTSNPHAQKAGQTG